ncbi:hypothetical protein [Niallia nealsonii]|nr:hypothetical protein [Niallia nealsonii]
MKRSIKGEYAASVILARDCNQLDIVMTPQRKSEKPLLFIMQNKYCCN